MKFWKFVFHLIIIYSLLFTGFFISSEVLNIGLPFSATIIILTTGLVISFISLLFFSNSIEKGKQNKIISLLTAFGIKFILYLGFIAIYYFLSDIKSTSFLVTFFIVYIIFTYYLLKIFIKTLSINKSEA